MGGAKGLQIWAEKHGEYWLLVQELTGWEGIRGQVSTVRLGCTLPPSFWIPFPFMADCHTPPRPGPACLSNKPPSYDATGVSFFSLKS